MSHERNLAALYLESLAGLDIPSIDPQRLRQIAGLLRTEENEEPRLHITSSLLPAKPQLTEFEKRQRGALATALDFTPSGMAGLIALQGCQCGVTDCPDRSDPERLYLYPLGEHALNSPVMRGLLEIASDIIKSGARPAPPQIPKQR